MESLRYLSSGLALSAALVAVALSASPALAAGSVLTPSAQTVQVGETISLSVTGFKPCPALESPALLWDQNPLSYKLVAGSLTANDFTVDFVVPSSPVGSHLIAAGCLTVNGYALQQRVPVKVVAAALALAPSPQSVQAGGTVIMTGSGFTQCTDPAGSTTVELSANGTPLATASGSNGAFKQAITVPSGTPAGPYPVTAQCPAQPGSDLTSTNVYVVTLALSPSSGIPGTTISVAGAGYTQCHEVQLQLLRDTTQAVATGSPFVPANGSFTAEVTVPSSAALGTDYQVDAGCYPAAGSLRAHRRRAVRGHVPGQLNVADSELNTDQLNVADSELNTDQLNVADSELNTDQLNIGEPGALGNDDVPKLARLTVTAVLPAHRRPVGTGGAGQRHRCWSRLGGAVPGQGAVNGSREARPGLG